eukprot:15349047-Ditylum_brightwellii.AAC.1
MHDKSKGGPDESLFCNAVPYFAKTCKAIKSDNKGGLHSNSHVDITYIHLANAASTAGLLEIEKDKHESAKHSIKNRIMTMEKEGMEFKKKCLSPELLDKLWEVSLAFKNDLYPDEMSTLGDPSLDEANMRLDFEAAAKTSLCMVDVVNVLSDVTWQEYFKSLSTSS